MAIVIIDDSISSQMLIKSILEAEGYKDILVAESAHEAYELVLGGAGIGGIAEQVDLILLDIMMPDIDGIEACRTIKINERLKDVPIIIITAKTDREVLKSSFFVGAMDYITKPLDEVELLARVYSALRLKIETDCRKARELELLQVKRQLEEANHNLQKMSCVDGLTGIANRRRFDDTLLSEWNFAALAKRPLSLIILDIDYFKNYNDTYGHLIGDECLKQVALAINNLLKRTRDIFARYGGEEFAAVLPNTDMQGALTVAERIRTEIESLMIPHANSPVNKYVTISLGVASVIPGEDFVPNTIINDADKALYLAKQEGRNRVVGRCE